MVNGKRNRIQEEHKWIISQNLAQYAGCWLAVFRKGIVAKDRNLEVVVAEVKRRDIPEGDPLYVRVPEGWVSA